MKRAARSSYSSRRRTVLPSTVSPSSPWALREFILFFFFLLLLLIDLLYPFRIFKLIVVLDYNHK